MNIYIYCTIKDNHAFGSTVTLIHLNEDLRRIKAQYYYESQFYVRYIRTRHTHTN